MWVRGGLAYGARAHGFVGCGARGATGAPGVQGRDWCRLCRGWRADLGGVQGNWLRAVVIARCVWGTFGAGCRDGGAGNIWV